MSFPHASLLGIDQLSAADALTILDTAEPWIAFNRGKRRQDDRLAGLTIVNAFFENSTRTLVSFELAGKRLGAQVVNMHVEASSVKKGETLGDTARTIAAMQPDVICVRHGESFSPWRIAEVVGCGVVNGGDGTNEHPTQALLDALTIRRRLGQIEGLTVAICGDVRHSRVAGSNIKLLPMLGANVRLVGPEHLLPPDSTHPRFSDFDEGIAGADVVMMLRIQRERMEAAVSGGLTDFHARYGLTRERLNRCAPGALVMHPGPMNRGVEIADDLPDVPGVSAVWDQVEAGVAVRMAVLDLITRERRG